MSLTQKCNNCGSNDIEADPARGDTVCTNCGTVLEDYIITSEVQFEENARGGANVIGQFVSADSKGGGGGFGSSFFGSRIESREITLNKAKVGIAMICNQLKLTDTHIKAALHFYKLALDKNLTRGRRNTLMQAACVYIMCRVSKLPHLLIDISDILQICCYELGRTYLQISQALCISLPTVDPCMYVIRFAGSLEFGEKTKDVIDTAQRIVKRMAKDSIDSGRRPSGLCGAALLIAARFHDFNRTTSDIVKIVKIHESTLRKRLVEFSDTPSSALTLDEFKDIDLEEEQDPPSFKAARKKDKERLQKLMTTEEDTLISLQKEIESQLDSNNRKRKHQTTKKNRIKHDEARDQSLFIDASTRDTIHEILQEQKLDDPNCFEEDSNVELGPNIDSMGLACSLNDEVSVPANTVTTDFDLAFDDIDDEELDAYIMNEDEVEHKKSLWMQINAEYLEQQKIKQEKLEKEKESGKPEKKKRTTNKRKQHTGPSTTAAEGIEKMLQEKKFSKKINYEVLKKLNTLSIPTSEVAVPSTKQELQSPSVVPFRTPKPTVNLSARSRFRTRPNININPSKTVNPSTSSVDQSSSSDMKSEVIPVEKNISKNSSEEVQKENNPAIEEYEEDEDYYDDDEEDTNNYREEEEDYGIEEY